VLANAIKRKKDQEGAIGRRDWHEFRVHEGGFENHTHRPTELRRVVDPILMDLKSQI
jgi:hypothetical protein